MTIELIYYPLHDEKINMLRKKLTLPAGSKIEDVLPLVHAKGLAEWKDDIIHPSSKSNTLRFSQSSKHLRSLKFNSLRFSHSPNPLCSSAVIIGGGVELSLNIMQKGS